ncbi:ABC transporter permease subunit [Gottfriedia sp. OAE603]|uniref:ABC transporter permease subunit n=1 Tax=Gottfriedia sp. OAE603 TaxID=2663872 RepID=UPI00178B9EED
MIQTSKLITKHIIQFLLTIVGIGFITALSFSLFLPKGERLSELWNQLQIFFWSFFYFKDLEVIMNVQELIYVPFYTVLKKPYVYSLTILFAAFICSIIAALLLSYITYMAPIVVKKIIHSLLFFLQSVPDVVMIAGLQIVLFWIFNKTGVMIIDPVAGLESNVYILPIFVVSIIPTIQLFQMIYLSINEEEIREYVEYARAKGLSKSWVLVRHILRNVTITLLTNTKLIFWVIISNLFIVEFLLNMKGYFSFLFKNMSSPEIFFMSLVLLFIPFFILDLIFKYIVNRLRGVSEFI